MALRKTPIDKLDIAIAKILEEYKKEIEKDIKETTYQVGKAGAQAINQSAARTFKGKKYRKSWTVTKPNEAGTRLHPMSIIYSKMPGLPHLLEHGHANAHGGGRTPGRPHIAPVEKMLNEQYVDKITRKLEK